MRRQTCLRTDSLNKGGQGLFSPTLVSNQRPPRLVAGRVKASASGRNRRTGSSLSGHHARLIDAEFASSSGKSAHGRRGGCQHKRGRRRYGRRTGREVVATLGATAKNAVNEARRAERCNCSVTAVAGGRLISCFSTDHCAQRLLSRSFVRGAPGSEEGGDRDGGDDADNRNNDEQLDQREALLVCLCHVFHLLLIR